jgi:hypothetical protein
MHKKSLLTIVAAAALLASQSALFDAHSLDGDASTVASTQDPETSAENADVAAEAQALGISEDEVRFQTALQDAMDTVDFSSIDGGFAEYGSVMGPEFHLWYRSAKEPSQEVKDALDAIGALEYVEFERVPLSHDNLVRRAMGVYNSIQARGLPVGATIDTGLGGVELHAMKPLTANQRASAAREAGATGLPFRWGEPAPVPAAANGGGRLFVRENGFTCTGGFVVAGSNGARSLSTAGHCGAVDYTASYTDTPVLTIKSRRVDAIYDVAKLDNSTVTWAAKFWDGTLNRSVLSRKLWSGMQVGDPVHKWGSISQYTVGTIVNRNACNATGCTPNSLWVEVKPNGAPEMCKGGDSGGPMFYGNQAYGIISSQQINGPNCIYMPQQLTSALGLTVVTQ